MTSKFALLTILATAAAPAFAAGDADKGKLVFNQCQTCHTVVDDTGAKLAGKGAKVGPNLYGVFGRQAGSYPDFKYGKSMVAAGEAGLVWDEAEFVKYVQDPAGYLKEKLGDKSAAAKMMFKVKNADDAQNVYAFLSQFSPAPADAAAAPADATAAPADGTTAPKP
jgi:cytochrome c